MSAVSAGIKARAEEALGEKKFETGQRICESENVDRGDCRQKTGKIKSEAKVKEKAIIEGLWSDAVKGGKGGIVPMQNRFCGGDSG
jgi:hypothetical protein